MRTIEISAQTGDSKIFIGETYKNLDKYIPTERSIIITDTNIMHYYRDSLPLCEIVKIGTGEGIKTLKTAEHIYNELIKLEADRSTIIVGVGGGVVCDITGFIASTYMRGVDFGFIASTLLAQVDAGIGGKNGINISGYKNIVGLINQPRFVICDVSMLKTLPQNELSNGLAEIVKSAVIGDSNLFSYLEKEHEEALRLNANVIKQLIFGSLTVKATIVNKDEREIGERRKLNFGHTIGHAMEKVTKIPHGEAVSVGMVVAANLSVKRGLLPEKEAGRIEKLLAALRLPTHFTTDKEQIKDAIRKDKKRQIDKINYVFLKSIGEAVIKEIQIGELEAIIDDMR